MRKPRSGALWRPGVAFSLGRLGVIGTLDNVRADRVGFLMIKRLRERNHPLLLQRSVQYDREPAVIAQISAIAKIRDQSSAHRVTPMAANTVAPVELSAGVDRRRLGGLHGRIKNFGRFDWCRRQASHATEPEGQDTADIALIARFF